MWCNRENPVFSPAVFLACFLASCGYCPGFPAQREKHLCPPSYRCLWQMRCCVLLASATSAIIPGNSWLIFWGDFSASSYRYECRHRIQRQLRLLLNSSPSTPGWSPSSAPWAQARFLGSLYLTFRFPPVKRPWNISLETLTWMCPDLWTTSPSLDDTKAWMLMLLPNRRCWSSCTAAQHSQWCWRQGRSSLMSLC